MTYEEFRTERTRLISEMFDNVDDNGIYPTSVFFEGLDKIFLDQQQQIKVLAKHSDKQEEENQRNQQKIKELREMGRIMIDGYANGLSDIAIAKAWKLFKYKQ